MKSRIAWVVAAVLAVLLLGGMGRGAVRLCPYLVAKYRGTFLPNFHLGGPAAAALREILGTCRREKIPVALVLSPD